jgi:hypothetical protein
MAQRTPVLEPPLTDIVRAYRREGPIPISEESYVQLALDDPDTKWELIDGLLVEKPGMSFTHLNSAMLLGNRIVQQIDLRQFLVLFNDGSPMSRSSPSNASGVYGKRNHWGWASSMSQCHTLPRHGPHRPAATM